MNWPKSVAALGVSAAAIAGVYFTGNPNCLWALLIVPFMYNS